MMRRRSRADKSLVCLLQGLTGLRVTVELRNETELRGKIQDVDALMNITMVDVTSTKPFQGPGTKLARMFVPGRQVRYVHIPDSIDVTKALSRRNQMSRGGQRRVRDPAKDAARIARQGNAAGKPGNGTPSASALSSSHTSSAPSSSSSSALSSDSGHPATLLKGSS